jgi:hypothetical protein
MEGLCLDSQDEKKLVDCHQWWSKFFKYWERKHFSKSIQTIILNGLLLKMILCGSLTTIKTAWL